MLMKNNFQSKSVPRGTRTIWRYLGALFLLFTFAIGNVWGALTAHTPGTYEKTIDKGGYGATIVTVAERDYEVYGFSYNSSGSKPQILWAGTSTNNASASQVLCSTLSAEVQEIAGWISMSTAGKSSTYSMPSSTEFAASSVGSTGLYQMKLQGHSFTIKVKGYDQFSFLGNDNNGTQSKGKYLKVTINGSDVTKDLNSSTTVRRYDLNPSIESTIVITGLNTSNEHIDAFSLRLPSCDAPTTAFSEGAYTVGESALALSSLISGNNSDGAITYVVKTDGGTEASIAAGSFTATAAGTATITATQAADATNNKCEKIIDFNVVVTASSCAATIPGDISKGALTAGEITLTADGSAESGDIWYWQDAADGTATNLGTGATKNINTADMYYIRSYNTAGDCWSAAKSIEVTAEELLEHYAITYNKGAYGTGEIAGGEKVEGVAYTLSSDRFTRAGYVQVGWATTDGGAKAYDLGGSYTSDAAQEFFPVWAETSTYVASFDSGEECSASTPDGWTFANAGSYGASDATADFECKFGSTCPASGSAANASYIAFAKSPNVYATYDLSAATTVAAVTGTFYVGSSSARTFTIDYLGADGTTILHTITVNHPSGSNWGADNVNETAVVDNVRYIKVKGMTSNQSWIVMSAFSVTYIDLVTKYNVTFDKNGGSGDDMATLKYAEGAEVTLPGCTFTAPDNKEFDAWTSTDVTISNNKFTMPNKPVTIKATWKAIETKYAISEGTPANGTVDADLAEASAGATVTITATPATDYLFSAWDVYKTGEPTTKVSVTETAGVYSFEMPAYAVTVSATFAADTRKKILYVTDNSEDATKANDKLYAALKDIYNVSIVGYASEADQTNYDLVVLHESIGGGNYGAAAVAAAKTGNTPVLNTKSYFYNDGRWNWGTPNAGQTVKGATLNSSYCNIADHPLFDGVTMMDGFFEITDDAAAKCMQPVGEFTTGKEGYTLATTPNSGEGNGCAIHELTPAQRGASGKYLMISVSNAKLNALNANGQKLFQNAAAYLIDGSVSWTPIAVPTTPEITGTTAYKTGENIALTASATGTIEAATYAWYKGATWAEAEDAGVIKAAATTAAGGNAYAKAGCAVGDAGKYWCVISNGTDCDVKVSIDVTVAQTFAVSYLPGDGTGATIVDGNATVVADCPSSFIAPTTGKMFYGWKDDDGNDVAVGAAVTSNLVLYAQWGDIMVAKIGDTMYPSLEAALAHAEDGEIVLLQDIDVTAQVEVLAGVTATLDLAGHKIEYTGSTTLTSGVILVHNGGSLTINDSSNPDAGSIVSGNKAYAAVALTKAGDDAANPAILTVNGGMLSGYYYGITGNGSRHNTVTTINGGSITGTVGIAIYHPQVGTLTVNNGNLTGVDAAIEMRAGTLVINDGTFTATATEFSCNPNGSGSTTSGAAIAIAQHTTKKDIEVTINGGTFNGVKALNESNPHDNDPAPQVDLAVTGGDFTGEVSTVDVNHFISGGTFKFEVLNDQCAPNFVPSPADLVTGKYTVEPKDAVSLIKAVATSTSQDITGENLTGIYKGAAHISASGSYKFNQGNYFMVQLKDGENFQAGDIVKINVASVNDCNGFALYSADEFTSANLIIDTHENSDAKAKVSTGINEVELPNTYAGSNKLYVARCGDCDKYLNAGINKVEVTRIVYPELKAITIDGRDGVINEAAKTVAVTIPYEADLAALTVVPTIVWNEAAAENSIVVNNGAAWTLGANTYKLTDKDGDYTVYTITLTRDILKHTVSFNTHGGSAVANVLVEHNAYLTAVPNDPSKEDYIFQYWSLTDGGDEVDITTVQIDEDKEFHAVWASEGAIKLINGNVVNHANFLTGTNETTVEIESVDYKCVDFTTSGSNRTTVASISDLKEFIQYNATTNKAKMSLTLYNTHSSAVSVYLHMLEEGSETPTTEEISVPAGEIFKTNYYAFNSEKNRSFYITCGNRNYIKVLQVKVVDDGTTTLKKAGQVGYSVKTLKSRIFAPQQSAISFEGLTVNANAVCKPLSTTALKIKNNYNISFHADVAMTLAVTTEGNQTYYVSATADGTTNETSFTGRKEFEITAGDWYIHAGNSELKVAKLEFIAPKCEEPTITTQPATDLTFGAGDMTATVVAATPTDGGTLKYQWYNASNDEEVEGATEATLTTTTEGTYYVIVTNTLADHSDNSVKSDEAQLAYRVMDDATLSALSASAGTLDPAFDKNVLEYRVDLPEGTVDVPTLSATATMAGYANVAINNATAFVNYEATSTVVVTSEDGTESKTYTVKFYVDHLLPQVDVTESTTWDWTYAAEGTVTIKVTDSTEPIKKNEEGLMANVRVDDNKPTNDATFNSQALLFYGENVRAKDGGRWYASLGHIKFNVTKPGIVEVEFSDNGSNNRCLSINGFMSPKSSSKTDIKTFKVFVPAGEVTLMGMEGADTDKYIRISKITYTVKESPDYWRNVSSNYGTLCVEHNVLVGGALGATFYQIASRNEDYDYKIDFEEVLPNEELKAGEPYLFKSNTGKIELFFSETTSNVAPIEVRGMIGNYAATTLEIDESNMSTTYYFANNKLWSCENLVGVGLTLNEHRAYIDFTKVPTYAQYEASKQQQNSAPRRRVSLEMNGEQVATGCENLNVSDKPVKMIINGQLFILRGEKMYDAKGQLVK